MIKWLEPAGYIRKDQLQKVQQGWAYLCDVGPEPRADKQPIHTEAQLKQAVRDFGEHLAKHFGAMTGREMFGGEIEDEIRALIKEIPAMTTQDQAIARLPTGPWSKEAEMLESWIANKPAPDCRTCCHAALTWSGRYKCNALNECTNGDEYTEASKIVLWRTE